MMCKPNWRFFYPDDKNIADLWLLNSCTVKNPAEDHLRYKLSFYHVILPKYGF